MALIGWSRPERFLPGGLFVRTPVTATHLNRETVQARLSRLEAEYGVAYREDETVEVDPRAFPEEVSLSRNGYDGSSYVWIVRPPSEASPLTESMPDDAGNDRDRVLMILGRGGDRWGVPGGGREGDETYEEGAVREVREETGIDCEITDLFGVRHERRTAPGHDEVLHNLRVLFEGRYEGGHIAIQPGELDGAAWLARKPQQVHPLAEAKADRWFDG
jgi:8-oxo-dGTP diphosphatase